MATSQVTITVTRGNVNDRENANLRYIFALMDEAVFYPHFNVAKTVRGWPAIQSGKRKRDQEMHLYIGHNAVVKLKMGQSSPLPILIIRILGRDVEFTVMVVDCLRVIRDERWAGPGRRCKCSQIQQGYENSYQPIDDNNSSRTHFSSRQMNLYHHTHYHID